MLNAEQNPFPDEAFGAWPATVEIHIVSETLDVEPGPHALDVPATGRSASVSVKCRTPALPGLCTARVLVMHRGNCLMSMMFYVTVGAAGGGYASVIDYVLTADLSQLTALSPQALAMHTSIDEAGDFRIVLQADGREAAPGVRYAAVVNSLQVGDLIDVARNRLIDVHFGRDARRSQYGKANSRSRNGCFDDLAWLAEQGWRLYQMAIGDRERRGEFRELLRETTRSTGRAAAIQIVNAGPGATPFPWQLVYDIPSTGRPPSFVACPMLDEWMSGRLAEIPAYCPYPHDKRNTLCPFGFWGSRTRWPRHRPPGGHGGRCGSGNPTARRPW